MKEQMEKKTMEINKHEDEIQQMEQKIDDCKVKLNPLHEEYKQVQKIGEQLSSITASKAKVEAEWVFPLLIHLNNWIYLLHPENLDWKAKRKMLKSWCWK